MNSTQVSEIKSELKARANFVESWLDKNSINPQIPLGLQEAMRYSLLAGGKRIRPVLCLAAANLFGLKDEIAMPFAAGIECIHTYSLIHDDLPAMDNDDLRRGKPSSHKKFNEATAILAGDALLTDAFALMCSIKDVPPNLVLKALSSVASAAGSAGMVGGQFLDIIYTAQPQVSLEELAKMHAMKTGALLVAPCKAGAILGGAEPEQVAKLAEFGKHLGAAFQIMDDILDQIGTEQELGKPVGSDIELGKHTYPSLLGLEKSRALAIEKAQNAQLCLEDFAGQQADFLRKLALYIVHRVS